jgi:hypothetical protein
MKPKESDWRAKHPSAILVSMKQYTVSDGKVVLTLQEAEEGGYVVTSPLDPQLITEAEKRSRRPSRTRETLWLLWLPLGEN